MNTFELSETYLILGDTDVHQLDGGEAFWERLATDDDVQRRAGEGWLVGRYPVSSSWDSWEMHPDGDEVVHAASGHMTVVIDTDDGEHHVDLAAGRTVVVPAGAWHTMDVIVAGATMNITFGRGTEHRSR